MRWPLSQDYNEAVQNPRTSFRDAHLREGQVVTNVLGIPQPCSGNFADVYAVHCPATQSKWAVKCFTREVHGLRERYREISQYLAQVRLPFTVDCQYQEEGIRVFGRWYPILKMHWVEGFTLNAFVRDLLDKPHKLDKLSRIWARMAGRLREAKLTHCDLQHGNVLLVPDNSASSLAVKLIDYDGMWVPSLANVPSGEVGHPAYQHPLRLREGIYSPEVDRFPLLVIYVALRALMTGGRQLWERYDTGDNMLFRQQDFEAPGKSPLFAELLRMDQPELRPLVVQLIDAARKPLDQTPLLEELIPNPVKAQPPRVAKVVQYTTLSPPERVEAPFEGIAESDSVPVKSAKGRGLLMGTVIAVAVCGFICLGLGTIFFLASGDKPSTSNQVAMGKTTPEINKSATPIMDSRGDNQPNPKEIEPRETIPPDKPAPKDLPKRERPKSEVTLPPVKPKSVDARVPLPEMRNAPVKVATKPRDDTQPKVDLKPPTKTSIVFLADLPELTVAALYFRKKSGDNAVNRLPLSPEIAGAPLHYIVNGEKSPHGLFLHPFNDAPGYVVYSLDKRYTRFRAKVGLHETTNGGMGSRSPLTFTVAGDWRVLWQSKRIQRVQEVDTCDISVEGLSQLILQVYSQGPYDWAHAVWVEPQLERSESPKPDRPLADNRLPEPDAATQKQSAEDVRDIYKADYASARQSEDWIALANKLLKRGMRPQEELARRFAYLGEARDTAARGGDAGLSFRAVDEMSKTFVIQSLPMKTAALGLAARGLRTDAAAKALLGMVLAVLDDAEAEDDYEHAAKLLATAQKVVQTLADPYLAALIMGRRNRLDRVRKEYTKIADSLKKLAGKPHDAEANRLVGQFHCFIKEDWSKGLPMLARGNEAALVDLAHAELADALDASVQAKRGQQWWAFAEQQSDASIKSAIQRHAQRWFRTALPKLNDLEKDRVESRLERKIGTLKMRPGLVTELFDGENFEKRVKSRLDYQIHYDWGLTAPDAGVPADHFSIRWQGWLMPPRAGKYTITLAHDDGVRLILDGKTLLDMWGKGGRDSVEIALTSQPHAMQLEFREVSGPAILYLLWSLDSFLEGQTVEAGGVPVFIHIARHLDSGFKEQAIPLESLYHDLKQERLVTP